jgi:hypothetical protein
VRCFLIIPTYLEYEKRISKILDFRPKLGEIGKFLSFFGSLAYSPKVQKDFFKVNKIKKFVVCSSQARYNPPFYLFMILS